jgi:hypothetical protein
MTTTTINYDELDTLMATLKHDEALPFVRYEALYEAIARDETPDTNEILDILKRTGKTRQDLEADVTWRIRRTEMIKEYQLIPELEAESDKALAEVRRLNAEQKKLEEEYELKKQPYRTTMRRLEHQLKEYSDHQDILIRECRCEALKTGLDFEQFQRDKVADALGDLNVAIHRQQGRIGEANDVLHKCKQYVYFDGKAERQKAAYLAIEDAKKEIARMQKEIAPLELKLAEHDVEIARIKEQMLSE